MYAYPSGALRASEAFALEYPYATQSVAGSISRNAVRGVSSIMSSATAVAGHPGLMPSRRATTLCTPSAAITTGAANRRPSRLVRTTRSGSSRACTTSTPGASAAPASTASATSSASNSTRRIISAAGASDSITVRSPSGPSRCRRASACVEMRDSSRSRYGNRFRTRTLMPPPHGLFRGNDERSSSRTRTPARASVRAAVAPAGPAPTINTSSMCSGETAAIMNKSP